MAIRPGAVVTWRGKEWVVRGFAWTNGRNQFWNVVRRGEQGIVQQQMSWGGQPIQSPREFGIGERVTIGTSALSGPVVGVEHSEDGSTHYLVETTRTLASGIVSVAVHRVPVWLLNLLRAKDQ